MNRIITFSLALVGGYFAGNQLRLVRLRRKDRVKPTELGSPPSPRAVSAVTGGPPEDINGMPLGVGI